MLSTNIGDTFTIHMDILLEISDERNNSITQTQTDWQETNAPFRLTRCHSSVVHFLFVLRSPFCF